MNNKINVSDYQRRLLDSIENGTYEQVLAEITNEMNYGTQISKIPLRFVNKSNNPDPEYAKTGDSGFDIRADLTEDVIIQPLDRALIPTGLYFELPINMELGVRSRSGLAIKNGVFVLNSPGTVDEGYRNSVGIILMNLGKEPFIVKNGDRIAQGVLSNVTGQRLVSLIKIDKIDTNTDRATDGFGSTGVR
jgi:dUTP pyrophosphatase